MSEMLVSHVVRSIQNGATLLSFDRASQANLFAETLNRRADAVVVRVVPVPRNPAWSEAKAPGLMAEMIKRATAASELPSWMSA